MCERGAISPSVWFDAWFVLFTLLEDDDDEVRGIARKCACQFSAFNDGGPVQMTNFDQLQPKAIESVFSFLWCVSTRKDALHSTSNLSVCFAQKLLDMVVERSDSTLNIVESSYVDGELSRQFSRKIFEIEQSNLYFEPIFTLQLAAYHLRNLLDLAVQHQGEPL